MTGGFDEDDLADWQLEDLARTPLPIAPEPATMHRELRGRRVLVGLPGVGWRSDLRADSPIVQGSRTYVPVLPEYEWYRAEAEDLDVFAPLVPVERVWVETLRVPPVAGTRSRSGALPDRLVSLDAPPRRYPVPVADATNVTGRRVVQLVVPDDAAHSERRDLRAVTEAYASAEGDICVRVATELDWYRWAWTGSAPKTLAVPIHLLWLE